METYQGCSSITTGTISNTEHQFYQNKITSVLSRCITKQNVENLELTCALYARSMQDLFVSIYANILKSTCNLTSLKYINIHCSFTAEPVQFAMDKSIKIVSIINHDIISKLYMNDNKPKLTIKENVSYKLKDDIVFDLSKTSLYIDTIKHISSNNYKYIKLSKCLSEKVIRLYVIADHAAQHFMYITTNPIGQQLNYNSKHQNFNNNIDHLSYIFSNKPDKRKHKLLYTVPDKNLFKEVNMNNNSNNDFNKETNFNNGNDLNLLNADEYNNNINNNYNDENNNNYDDDNDDDDYEDIEDDIEI